MQEKCPILVSFWVANALKRKGLALKEILDYAKVRQVLSIEDAAGLLSLQQLYVAPFIKDNYLGHLLSSWERSCTQELRRELDSSVVPLSYSEGSKESNLLRLIKEEGNDNNIFADSLFVSPSQQPFEIVDFDRDAFAVVLYPGFTASVLQRDGQLSLVRAILKLFYVYYDVYKVSSHNIFSTYVKLLNDMVYSPTTA